MTSSSATATTTMILLPNRETVSESIAREQIAEDLVLSVPGYYQFIRAATKRDDFRLNFRITEVEARPPGRIISLLQQHPQLVTEEFPRPQREVTRSLTHIVRDPTRPLLFPNEEAFTPLAYMLLLSVYDDLVLLRRVINLNPEVLMVPREENGNLLLHDFCEGNCRQNNQNEIVQLLLNSCPEAAAVKNNLGLTPLHIWQNKANLDATIVRALVDCCPEGLLQVDESTGMSCIARALIGRQFRENHLEYILDKIDELDWDDIDTLLVTREVTLETLPVKNEHFMRLLPRTQNMILRHVSLEGGGEALIPPIENATIFTVETLELSNVQLTSGGTPANLVSQISGHADNLKELTLSIISENGERYDVTELATTLLKGNRIEKVEIRNGFRISMNGLHDDLKSNKSLKQFYCENSLHFVESRKLLADILEHENDVLQDVAVQSQYSACPHVKRIVGWTMLNHCGRRNARLEATTIPALVSFLTLLMQKLQPVREPLAQLRCRPTFETTIETTLSLSLDSASVLNAQFCFLRETASIWSNAYAN